MEIEYQEIPLHFGDQRVCAFLQLGFFRQDWVTDALHHHRYGEVHVVIRGHLTYQIQQEIYDFPEGSCFWVPAGVFHRRIRAENGLLHSAFQLSVTDSEFHQISLPRGVAELLQKATEDLKNNGDGTELYGVLTLLCSLILRPRIVPKAVEDREFAVYEFFAHRYPEPVELSDLARELGLSEKQTQRVVVQCTGGTFREELRRRRMEAARMLMKEENRSLQEIAHEVGYQSYSGFWKAWKETE